METKAFRPEANIFPLLDGEEYESLKADIATNGLLEPIWLHPNDGAILDGRNRYRVCIDLGIEPEYRYWDGQGGEEAFVISLNLHRRHLTKEQREKAIIRLRQDGLSQRAIAQKTGLSKATVNRALHELVSVPNGTETQPCKMPEKITGLDGKQRKATMPANNEKSHAIHFSSETPEWYTPDLIIDRLLELWGAIDLDPCSNSAILPNVPAQEHYTQEDDGLSLPWRGKIYMNPPYGNELADWIDKLVSEYKTGNISEAIALTPARTDTKWFRALRQFPRCFIFGRLKFSQSDNGAPFPSMLTYLGDKSKAFREVFGDIGDIYILWQETHEYTR